MQKEYFDTFFKKFLIKQPHENLKKLVGELNIPVTSEKSLKKENILNNIVEYLFEYIRTYQFAYCISRTGVFTLNLDIPIFKALLLREIAIAFNNEQVSRQNMHIHQAPTFYQMANHYPEISMKTGDCLCYQIPNIKKNGDVIMICVNNDCKRQYHPGCMKIKSFGEQKSFECPRCFLKKCDPLHRVETVLLEPFYIRRKSENFLIETDLYKYLERSDYTVEIRCIRVEEKIYYEQTYPDLCDLYLNERKIVEFKPLQKNSALKKRKDEKLSIKEYIRHGPNSIRFDILRPSNDQKQHMRIEEDALHLCGLYLVRILQPQELVEDIKINNVISEQDCRNKIKNLFSNNENDVCVDKISVNINDPIDALAMRTPCRGRFCTHQQCFSLENFISMTKQSMPRKWKCPICKIKSFDLLIDGFQQKILFKIMNEKLRVFEITFLNDGNYQLEPEKPLKNERNFEDSPMRIQTETKAVEKKAPANKDNVIILDEDEEEDNIGKQNDKTENNMNEKTGDKIADKLDDKIDDKPDDKMDDRMEDKTDDKNPVNPETWGDYVEQLDFALGKLSPESIMDIELSNKDIELIIPELPPIEAPEMTSINKLSSEDEQMKKLTESMFRDRMKRLEIHSKLREMSNYEDFRNNNNDIRTRDTKFNYAENNALQKMFLTVVYQEFKIKEDEQKGATESSKKKKAEEVSIVSVESEEKTLKYFSEAIKKTGLTNEPEVLLDLKLSGQKIIKKVEKPPLPLFNSKSTTNPNFKNSATNSSVSTQNINHIDHQKNNNPVSNLTASSKPNSYLLPQAANILASHLCNKQININTASPINLPPNGMSVGINNQMNRQKVGGQITNLINGMNGLSHQTQILYPSQMLPIYNNPVGAQLHLQSNLNLPFGGANTIEKNAAPDDKRMVGEKPLTGNFSNSTVIKKVQSMPQKVTVGKSKGNLVDDPICID